jgi:murein L,D-transpeptidase YcbB/YkuD
MRAERNDWTWLTAGFLLIACSSCSDGSGALHHSIESVDRGRLTLVVDQGPSVDLRPLIGAVVSGHDAALGKLTRAELSALRELYQPELPLWLDPAGRLTGNAHAASKLLAQAADEGLDAADYNQGLLAGLFRALNTTAPTALESARLDVALSAGMLRYWQHLHMGRVDPRAIGFRLGAPPHQHDFLALLRSAIAGERILAATADLQPRLVQYRLLRNALARYRVLESQAWTALPPASAAIHPGDQYEGIGILHRQLVALGDLPADAAPPSESGTFDGELVDSVKRFQVRHGLAPDGVLGKVTLAALRVPTTQRVRQIELALERMRWVPDVGDKRLLALNIPMFRLWAWDTIPADGAPLFGMDVIVGRALSTQTPIFVEDMREVIFRPYWNVPRSILRHEVLPRLERDPDYLRREDMEIVRGAGDAATHVELTPEALAGLRQGVLRVRQRPGPRNALGLIKFVFPNQEDVYMHGTPALALFAKSRRDFSHGCVRVADPVALAEWVLHDRPEWTRDRIVAATIGSETVHVTLPRPIQVILFYTTAAVMPEDGTIRFAEDIYRHDARLERALAVRNAE